MLTTIVVVGLGVVAAAAVAYVRSHPKPANESLPTYAEEVAQEIPTEVKTVAEEVVTEVKTEVKKARKKKTDTTAAPAADTAAVNQESPAPDTASK